MRTVVHSILLGILWSCSGKGDDSAGAGSETDADTDADSDTDTDTDTDTDVSCKPIKAGHWYMGGTEFGMAMAADVTVDTKKCMFTFSNWNMAMSVPEGGTMDGTDIQLAGSTSWSTCTGIAKSPMAAAGTCGSGGSWTMEFGD